MANLRSNFQPDEELRFTFLIPLDSVWNYDGYRDSFFTPKECKEEVLDFLIDTGFFDQFPDMILESAVRIGDNFEVTIADACGVDPELNINLGTLGEEPEEFEFGPIVGVSGRFPFDPNPYPEPWDRKPFKQTDPSTWGNFDASPTWRKMKRILKNVYKRGPKHMPFPLIIVPELLIPIELHPRNCQCPWHGGRRRWGPVSA